MDGGGVTNESDGHFQTLGRDVANGGLHVVGDPLYEIGAVFVLDIQHLFIDFFGAHSSSEHGGGRQISAVSGISSAHHVFGIEHLLGQFGHSQGSVLLGSSGSQRGESDHEEMESGERNQVDSQFPQVAVQLTREPQTASDSGDGDWNEMVQVSIGGSGQFESSIADVIESLVVDDHSLVGVLDQLVDWERAIVRLDHSVGDFGRRNDGEGLHDSIGILLSDLGDQESSHSGPSSAS